MASLPHRTGPRSGLIHVTYEDAHAQHPWQPATQRCYSGEARYPTSGTEHPIVRPHESRENQRRGALSQPIWHNPHIPPPTTRAAWITSHGSRYTRTSHTMSRKMTALLKFERLRSQVGWKIIVIVVKKRVSDRPTRILFGLWSALALAPSLFLSKRREVCPPFFLLPGALANSKYYRFNCAIFPASLYIYLLLASGGNHV